MEKAKPPVLLSSYTCSLAPLMLTELCGAASCALASCAKSLSSTYIHRLVEIYRGAAQFVVQDLSHQAKHEKDNRSLRNHPDTHQLACHFSSPSAFTMSVPWCAASFQPLAEGACAYSMREHRLTRSLAFSLG